jgi:mevalonate kinase
MKWSKFQTEASAKWVLSGEHSVLRGVTAVALPHPEFRLKFTFTPSSGKLRVVPESATSVIVDLLRSIGDEWNEKGLSFNTPEGEVVIESTIPIGAGLGSSAALSVSMTRWLAEPLSIAKGDQFEFAKKLEHRFHGRSSGMDVAAVISAQPISFVMNKGHQLLGVKKLPKFTFHDTGERARTSDCVMKVRALHEDSPTLGMQLDEQMAHSSRLAVEGLVLFDAGQTEKGTALIAEGMKQGQDCFKSWGLIPTSARHLEEDLLAQGAKAVKITGSGGGGMIVALWDPV